MAAQLVIKQDYVVCFSQMKAWNTNAVKIFTPMQKKKKESK